MKTQITIILLCFTIWGQAQSGFIHRDSVLAAIPTYLSKVEAVAKMQQQYNTEIKDGRTALQQKLNSLVGPYNPQEQELFPVIKQRMKPMDTLQINLLLDEDKSLIKREETYKYMVNMEYMQKVQPILDKVNELITQYAINNKLDAVYIIEQLYPALTYINPKQIITEEIKILVQKEFK